MEAQTVVDKKPFAEAEEKRVEVSLRGADDVERTHHRRRARGLLTVFGPVTALRMSYGACRHASLSPFDASLNLPEELQSHGLRRLAARYARS